MVVRMVIKMIIFSFVSILVFSHIVTCFPSLEGDSRLINDTHKMLAKLAKSNIKKPKLPNEPVIKFLKKLDCNSDPNFDRDKADSSEILESCDFDNWEINEKAAKKKPSSKAETVREISSTTHTFSTYRQGGESKPSNDPNTGLQSSGKVNDKKLSTKNGKSSAGTSGKKTAQRKHYTEKPSDSTNYDDNVDDEDEEGEEEQEEPTTGGDEIEIDYGNGDNDGLFVRILLMLILVMQNAFVFVLFLFYRSMKNNAK